MTIRRAARLLAVGALGGVLLAGCGDEPGLDVAAVESYLASSQASTYGDTAVGEADCPGDRALEEGMTLTCTLAVADASVPYRLTLRRVRSEQVSVAVALDAVVLRTEAIRDFVRSTLPKAFRKASVTCGDRELVVTDVGESFECLLSSGAQRRSVTITVEDEAGRISVV